SPAASSDGSLSVNSSFSLSVLIADRGSSLPSTEAASILSSSPFNTSSCTGLRTFSFTVSLPANVKLSRFGTMRIAYSVGTTSFGSFPGVSLKLNGFSTAPTNDLIRNRIRSARSGARMSGFGKRDCSLHQNGRNRAPGGRAPLLNNQYQQQLSPAHLRAFNHQRAAFA